MNKPLASASTMSLVVRRLRAGDVAEYRELRLEGLRCHPEAFGSSWEDEADKPITWWVERLDTNLVLGGWVDGPPLAGIVGLRVESAAKLRHKGLVCGMYVRPQARGTGLAAALVREVVDEARTLVEEVRLTVVSSNVAARRLYEAAGFREYGCEPRALKVGDDYYDEVLMGLPPAPTGSAACPGHSK